MSGAWQRGVALAARLVLIAALGWTVLKPAGQYRVTAYFAADRRPVPRLRRAGARHPGRHDHRHRAARRPGAGRDEHRRGLRRPRRRRRGRPRAVPGVRPLRAVLARSTTAAPTMEDGAEIPLDRTATPVELDEVYGALDELSHRARPERRQRERRAVGPGRRRCGEPRGQRRGAQPDADRLLAGGRRRSSEQPGRPVQLAGQPADLHHGAGHHRRAGRPVQRQHGRGQPSCSPTSGEDLRRRVVAARRSRWPTSPTSSQDNTSPADHQRRPARRRDPRAGAAAGRRWPRCSTWRRPRWATWRAPTTPTSGRWTPATTGSARRTPRSSSAGPSPRSAGSTWRPDLPLPLPVPDPTAPLRTATEQICARLLSGDANADGSLDDLNSNGIPDYEELRQALLGGGGGRRWRRRRFAARTPDGGGPVTRRTQQLTAAAGGRGAAQRLRLPGRLRR